MYDDGLIGMDALISHPRSNNEYFDVYQNYVIRYKERDKLVEHLRKAGVEVLISWPNPMHKQKALELSHFSLPMTERISSEVVSLPMYPELRDEEVDYVIKTVLDFFS
jgi:dTDP-4-amino-4,6-dideoxygalactose transaminase